jgi:hypothetical protein
MANRRERLGWLWDAGHLLLRRFRTALGALFVGLKRVLVSDSIRD